MDKNLKAQWAIYSDPLNLIEIHLQISRGTGISAITKKKNDQVSTMKRAIKKQIPSPRL